MSRPAKWLPVPQWPRQNWAQPASPLKALSFWGAGLVQSRPPAFPAKMSKLWASTTASGAIVRDYQSPPMVNAGLPGTNLAAEKGGNARGWRGAEHEAGCPVAVSGWESISPGRGGSPFAGTTALVVGEIHLTQVASGIDDPINLHAVRSDTVEHQPARNYQHACFRGDIRPGRP